MKKALQLILTAILLIVSSKLGAQPTGRSPELRDLSGEEIPLKNWAVNFDDLLSAQAKPGIEAMALPSVASHFIAVVPCRVVDTRNPPGAFGGPSFAPSQIRTFNIPTGPCPGIPVATAYSLNFAIVNYDTSIGTGGFLTAYPSGGSRPNTATINFGDGIYAVSNAAIVPSEAGSIDVFSSGATHLIIDINGFLAPGVVTSLSPGTGMTGGGTGAVTLGIATGGVGSAQLATDSVTADEIAANAVGASEIATDAVGSIEIATDAVGSSEIATNAVGSSEIASGAVTNDEIAFQAVDAAELATQRSITYGAGVGSSNVQVLNFGGLVLTANCNAGPDIELIATTTTNDGSIASSIGDDNNDFDVGESADVMSGDDNNVAGTLVYRNRGVTTVTVHWHAFENTPSFNCLVIGIATKH